MNTRQTLVQWSYPEPDATSFLMERSADSGSSWPLKLAFSYTASSYIDSAVDWYNEYFYHIAAANPRGTGSFGPAAGVYIQLPSPITYAWQNGSASSATAFWNYQGWFSMSVSRSADGGVTWPLMAAVTPTSGSTYYYLDRTVSVGQTYTYRLRDMKDPHQSSYDIQPVTINPPSPVTSLAFGADSGFEIGNYVPWEVHTASLLRTNDTARGHFSISRWLLGGDNGYFGSSFHNGYQGQCFQLLGPTESICAILGNHDLSDMGGVNAFRNYFGYQTAQFMWQEGCVQGVNITTTSETSTAYASGSANWLFLSNSLSRSLNDPSIAWRIVMVHAPVLSSLFVHPGNPTLQLIPWEQWGVDAVFSGHNHAVERLESGSVMFVTCGTLGNEKSPYWLRGSPNTRSKFILADSNDGFGPYCGGYVYTLLQATPLYLSMSFYSGSTKVHDTGSTSIPNAHMDGYSFIKVKLPPQGTTTLAAALT